MAIAGCNTLECEGLPSLFAGRNGLVNPERLGSSTEVLAVLKSEGKPSHSKARGMTLVELLVVIGIILLAVVMFVPRLRPAMEKSRIREAARAIQIYLNSARNQAMATGRSCGVMIEPLPSETGCAMTLSQVETPVPYGGDTVGATATVTYSGTLSSGIAVTALCSVSLSPPALVPINVYDSVQVGYQGYPLTIVPPSTNQSLTVYSAPVSGFYAQVDISHGEAPAWMCPTSNPQRMTAPYKIWRWPVKTAAAKLQLPAPVVIDLTCSGNDPVGSSSPTWPIQTSLPTPSSLPTPVIIMFAADGRIDWVSNSSNPGGGPMTTPVYLLVGLRNKVFDSANNATMNLNDYNSLWISIDAATGLVVVADMAALPKSPTSVQSSDLWTSRAFARQASANGGGK